MSRLPISVRLAVLSSAALTALLFVVGVAMHQQLGAGLRDGIDQQLVDLVAALPSGLPEEDLAPPPDEEFGGLELSDRLVQLADRDGRLLQSSDDSDGVLVLEPADLEAARSDGAVLRTVADPEDEGEVLRALAVPYGDDGLVAVLATELDAVEEAQQALVSGYVPAAGAGVLAAAGLGYAIARRGLAPVRRMTDEAEAIHAEDLSRRLSVPESRDEVGRLGRTLNKMLDRLDAAVARERRFTADSSHELRTPLAIMSAAIELARGRVTDPMAGAALDTAQEEAARLAGLVDDLLVLARAEAGRLEGHRPVDLGELVQGVVGRFATLAAGRGVRLRATGAAVVRGDEAGLQRAVANVVDNAVRQTPAGGSVTVEVRAAGSAAAEIIASDTGPGVPDDRLPHLFDRFTRVDDARHRPGGAGLGLAIVAAVAAAHGGGVAAVNRPGGGLTVTVALGERRPPG